MIWNDSPAFEYRGFHIDCARHMFSIDELKKVIDMASKFRFNYFHWHLSDDQGFRIESEVFPNLHKIGGYREGDHFAGYKSNDIEGGYYTKAQIRDLINFCSERDIEIIPEIDMPGHVSAILAAYPHLSCNGSPIKVITRGGIFKNLFCISKKETFDFIKKLLDEMIDLFPCKYFHIGGDEVPTDQWEQCPSCKQLMKYQGFDSYIQLQCEFENEIAKYLKSKGKIPIVWNDALNGGNIDSDVIVQCWLDDENGMVSEHIANGGKIIMSNFRETYCDYPYGKTSLKQIYEQHIIPESMKEIDGIEKSVLGNECLLWTEFIRTNEELEQMMWPRYAASGYVGWQGSDRASYGEFSLWLKDNFHIFKNANIKATGEDGWILDEETCQQQIELFELMQQDKLDEK